MTAVSHTRSEARGARGTFWALVPVGLLAASLLGVGTMASIAARDPGFALERNYYEHAVQYDREQAQAVENQRLGYRIELELPAAPQGVRVVARILDREGAPLRGASVGVEAFANARSADRRALSLAETSPGSYEATLPARRPGLWEFRFTLQSGADRFTETVRRDLVLERGEP